MTLTACFMESENTFCHTVRQACAQNHDSSRLSYAGGLRVGNLSPSALEGLTAEFGMTVLSTFGAEDQRKRTKLPADRVKNQSKRLKGNRAEEDAVALFTKNYRGGSLLPIKLEGYIAQLAGNLGAICQREGLFRMGLDSEPAEDGFWHHRVDGSGVHEESKLCRLPGMARMSDDRVNVDESHSYTVP